MLWAKHSPGRDAMRVMCASVCLGAAIVFTLEGQGKKMVDIPINVRTAVNLLEAAARQEPMDEVRRRCYASLLYYMGRSDDASRIAQEFLLRGGASASLYGRTARILAINGNADSSMQTLESGAKAHPKSARLVFLI